LASARARWVDLNRPQKKLLAVLKAVGHIRSLDHLAELAGMDMFWAKKHYGVLVNRGMIAIERNNTPRINPHIDDLIEREQTHAVATQIIRPGAPHGGPAREVLRLTIRAQNPIMGSSQMP
jgi:hypothetical protein